MELSSNRGYLDATMARLDTYRTAASMPAAHSPTSVLLRTAELLHAYGTPSYRFEAQMRSLATALRLRVQVSFSPTVLILAVESDPTQGDAPVQTFVRRVEPGGIELGRLAAVNELIEDLIADHVDPQIAGPRLDAIANAPARFGKLAVVAASGMASAAAAVLFGGGVSESVVAGCLGAAVSTLSFGLTRNGARSPLFEPLAAMMAAVTSRIISNTVLPHVDELATLAALIVLLPGLSLSVALVELATRHLVSGTARLAGAATTFLSLTFGVALGRALVGIETVQSAPATPSDLATYGATVVASASFAILFSVRPREWAWVFVAGGVAVAGASVGTASLGPQLGAFVGALGVGLLGNLYAWRGQRPSLVVLIPGILLLVPGSIGYRALGLMMSNDVVAGMQAAFETVLVATSLAAGLSVAAGLLPRTQRALNSP